MGLRAEAAAPRSPSAERARNVTRADVVVVGCGVMGAATARALAMNGHGVVVLERFEIGHASGSSHGSARIYRHSYTDARYVRMMHDALPLWRALEEEAGERLLVETGAVNIGENLDELERAISVGGGSPQRFSPEEVLARFGVRAPLAAVFDPSAGVVRADAAWRALTSSAVNHGAVMKENARVLALRPRGDRVDVVTENETIDARTAIVTAGAFARELLAPAGIDLPVRVTRETVSYFPVSAAVPVIIDWSDPLVYALPAGDGTLKIGRHITGPVADPEGREEPRHDAEARAWIAEHVPAAGTTPRAQETCLYTMTADENFILERHGPVVVGSPCSGHGFKFAPLIGARLAAMA